MLTNTDNIQQGLNLTKFGKVMKLNFKFLLQYQNFDIHFKDNVQQMHAKRRRDMPSASICNTTKFIILYIPVTLYIATS